MYKVDNDNVKKVIDETIQFYDKQLRSISLQIHDNPELGNKEYKSYQLLTKFLENEGFKVTYQAAGLETAFIAEFSNGEGRRVAFCSEYDALPGVGHACGHNLIAIAGLSCALSMKRALEKRLLKGSVYLFGTPAEETTGGKIDFVKKGIVNELADFSMMLHPAAGNACWTPFLALHSFTVEYFGRESHAGGAPWEGINALDALMQGFNNVALLRQQTITSNRIHGIIKNGGQAGNVIPAYTSGEFYARALTRSQLSEFKPRIENCFRAAALATGCDYKITWAPSGQIDDVFNNDVLADLYIDYMKEKGEEFFPRSMEETVVSGSTDFGNISYAVPGLHPMFAISTTEANHTIEFTAAARTKESHYKALQAAGCLTKAAVDIFLSDDLFNKVVESFKKGKK